MRNRHFIKLLCCLSLFFPGFFQSTFSQTTPEKIWQDDKFSMFIHFGLYSHFGGVWNGEQIERGYSEQIQSHAGIHSDLYAREAANFNPKDWDAEAIVQLAKAAGMRSIVITSKHHDGFCMWDTETTDFNIVDATPFGRDVLRELSEACARNGLKFGLYFSLIDWHYPQAYPISSHNADFITPEHHNFNKAQLAELLTQYGPISELWFDMGSLSYQQSKELRELVKQYQPDCLISGRLGNDQGDFCVMGDNQYPDYTIAVPWQVPASLYDETWGHRSWQEKIAVADKAAEKIRGLVNTVARGGNYLLNIGPTGTGAVTEHEGQVLENMGSWLYRNGAAIYGTQPVASDLAYAPMTQKGDTLFVHLLELPSSGKLQLKNITQDAAVTGVTVLDDPDVTLTYGFAFGNLEISLPDDFLSEAPLRVLQVITSGTLQAAGASGMAAKRGLELSAINANPSYSFSGVDYYSSFRSTVGYSWEVQSPKGKSYIPYVYYSAEELGSLLSLNWNNTKIAIQLSDGEPVNLPNRKIKWGSVYLNGPHSGFIDRIHGNAGEATPVNPWNGKNWQLADGGDLQSKPTTMFENWYALQEIEAASDSQVLVEIPLNDGLAVYLNGTALLVTNNPMQEPDAKKTVLLPLKKGKNTLLVKCFNRFNDRVLVDINPVIPQTVYRQQLPDLQFTPGETVQIGITNTADVPIHRNLELSNIKIVLE
jgi:alpha-L-fucosidase